MVQNYYTASPPKVNESKKTAASEEAAVGSTKN
jgi:hypothetical protein